MELIDSTARLATRHELATKFEQPRGGVGVIGPIEQVTILLDSSLEALEVANGHNIMIGH